MSEENKTAGQVAAHVGGLVRGDAETVLTHIAGLLEAGAGALTFVDDIKRIDEARTSRAACIIVPQGLIDSEVWLAEHPCLIEAKNAKLAFAQAAKLLRPRRALDAGIHPSAIIASSARVDATAYIGARVCIGERTVIEAGAQIYPGCVIGDDVVIGRDSTIHPNVTIYENVTLGARVVLHAGVAIGADGFGYVRDGESGEYHRFPQVGTVIIEDDVEIGANSCVDRAALGVTRIGAGTKIDNLVQVGHNVSVGARTVIASQTGISGSTVIEDDCVIGGQVGFGDHARVERGAIIGSKAGVLPGKIVRAGVVMWGVPVRPLDEYKRLNALFGRLPEMRRELSSLRAELTELAGRIQEK